MRPSSTVSPLAFAAVLSEQPRSGRVGRGMAALAARLGER